MKTAESVIFDDIIKCGVCDDHKPFFFEMGKQRIMLISFSPTHATLHRPLYFIQLFRKICLALFGDVSPSERFIKEFYDPEGNIYWTHYQKCFKRGQEKGAAHCIPLLKRELEVLDPDIVILLGNDTISHLPQARYPFLTRRKDGTQRKIFTTDVPKKSTVQNFEEIRKAIKPYIVWVKVECEDLDFSSVNFMDLEFASIEFLNRFGGKDVPKISHFENEWINGIILPNIQAYNLILQVFIFIESNIKNLLESRLNTQENIETRWFTPFEKWITNSLHNKTNTSRNQKQAIHYLMENIDSLHTLRNVIVHKNGVIGDRSQTKNMKSIYKLKRLKGVYIYGGNSVFISRDGIDHILQICDNFRKVYAEHFI